MFQSRDSSIHICQLLNEPTAYLLIKYFCLSISLVHSNLNTLVFIV
ncbi:hypothetical protein HOF65_00720 [bacterium]|nr:hypothetical protein [bacterium]MBT3852567.1 hypothetical protein [bacterium]MBT4632496.1 hypothetical protein [bacterium]MBT6778584.1 hypothetical protein [bacterium]